MINQRSTTSQITWPGIAGKVDSDHTAKLGPNLVPDIRPPKIPAATFLQGASLAAGRARSIPPGLLLLGERIPMSQRSL